MIFILYLVTGALAGTLSGLLGVGGGIIVVPMLILLFKCTHAFSNVLIMHVATGTSLAIMMFTTASSANAYYRRDLIVWPIFFRFLPGLCIGMIVGSTLTKQLSSNILIELFAIFLIIIAIYLLVSKSEPSTRASNVTLHKKKLSVLTAESPNLHKELLFISIAISIGLLSTFFGIGGGLLMLPFFLFIGLSMHESSGTTSICGVPIAIIGTITLTLTGWGPVQGMDTPFGTVGYIYWPAAGMVSLTSVIFAPIGTRLAMWFQPKTLKRFLVGLLLFSSVNLWLISM
ncbi:MAG: sulfite exporter TauE/SafE family protein [Legionellaceae bacterium]|nr:sulfite exporter TauE/SafE family protein [Legionellaceae bacterium]